VFKTQLFGVETPSSFALQDTASVTRQGSKKLLLAIADGETFAGCAVCSVQCEGVLQHILFIN
jgi:hypothetical protein